MGANGYGQLGEEIENARGMVKVIKAVLITLGVFLVLALIIGCIALGQVYTLSKEVTGASLRSRERPGL